MTANTPAILADAAANLSKLHAVAHHVNDPQLAACVHRLSDLMQTTVDLLSDLTRTDANEINVRGERVSERLVG
jgi:hypothetical protein